MDNLKLRLNILKNSGQIDDDTEQKVINFLENLSKELNITITEENASMLTMHAAMALSRIKKNETVNPVEDVIINEIINSEYYETASELLSKLLVSSDIVLPDSELGYFKMHLVTLLSKEDND